MAYIVWVCSMAYVVMADIVMAYIVMAYIVMAIHHLQRPAPNLRLQALASDASAWPTRPHACTHARMHADTCSVSSSRHRSGTP